MTALSVSARRLAGKREEELGAHPRLRLQPDAAAVAFDDLLADRQADPRPAILIACVQALKDHEDAFETSGAIPMPLSATVKVQPLSCCDAAIRTTALVVPF